MAGFMAVSCLVDPGPDAWAFGRVHAFRRCSGGARWLLSLSLTLVVPKIRKERGLLLTCQGSSICSRTYSLFSLVGVKHNLSLLDIC